MKKNVLVYFDTHGCMINMYETAAIKTLCKEVNITEVDDISLADYYVLNSCCVTAKADAEARKFLRRAKRLNPTIKTILTGCYANHLSQQNDDLKLADVTTHNDAHHIRDILTYGTDSHNSNPLNQQSTLTFADHYNGNSRAFLKIQEGCKDFCAYCIVPFTRPHLKSVPVTDVIKEIYRLKSLGFNEVTLGGTHLGYYGKDLGLENSLMDLFNKLSILTDLPFIRISSLEPRLITMDLINFFASHSFMRPHLHVPIQSGCDATLARMNRRYTTEIYKNALLQITKSIPNCAIGADIMVGFPGESEGEFSSTVNFVESQPFSYLHVFPFSPRKGTQAEHLPNQVDRSVSRKRALILRQISDKKKYQFMQNNLNTVHDMIIEQIENGVAKGNTDNYIFVSVPALESHIQGQQIKVKLEEIISNNEVRGCHA